MRNFLILLLSAILLSSCEAKTVDAGEYTNIAYNKVVKFTYDGHQYIRFMMNGYSYPVVHDPDCPCHDKE